MTDAALNLSPRLPDWSVLSLPRQVAQMVVVRASGYLFDHQIRYPAWEPTAARLQYLVKELGVGGVILLGASAGELWLRTRQLQDWANIPLLIAADVEEGVGQRFAGATWFPPPMALGAIFQQNPELAKRYAQEMGQVVAQEALAIGLNWVLAPVVDVNNNPDNPVINVRAFGETPEVVQALATSFLQGTQSYPVLTAAKHFPGHGDTTVDSHLELPIVPHDEARLHQVELPAFAATIAAGVDAVMSAHLQIPAWDTTYPATLSYQILTQKLREGLNFDGLIVTDALVMGAIANRYGNEEAAVLAVEAGADILLMPANPEQAIQAVCQAIETGRIPLERIHDSLERIWRAKQKVQQAEVIDAAYPHAWETLPSHQEPDLAAALSRPETISLGQHILRDSQQFRRPVMPLVHVSQSSGLISELTTEQMPTQGGRNLIVVDHLLSQNYLDATAPAIAIPQKLGYRLEMVDRHTSEATLKPMMSQSAPTLLQVFVRGNPFRGSAGLTQVVQTCFRELLAHGQLQALVIYGSPYILQQLYSELPETIPYVFTYGQMPVAQAEVFRLLFEVY